MTRAQLEHVVRASAAIVNEREIVVIKSQAILGEHPHAPAEFLVSMEADVYPRRRPELAIQIDGAIGERSLFHETFGYFAHGVAPETAILPEGWEERLVTVDNQNTMGAVGLCLETHDIATSKLVAGRENDLAYVGQLLRHGLIAMATMEQRLRATALADETLALALARLRR